MIAHHIGPLAAAFILPGDPFWSSVALVTEFNTFLDKGPNNRTIQLRGEIYAQESPAREGYSLFAKNNDNSVNHGAVKVLSHTKILAQNFTIECWFNSLSEPPSSAAVMGVWNGNTGGDSWRLFWDATNNRWIFTWSISNVDSSAAFNHATNFSSTNDGVDMATAFDGNWHHLAIVRNDTIIKVYVDGFQGGTASVADNTIGTGVSFDNVSTDLTVGAVVNGSGVPTSPSSFNIEDVRITLGVARYTAAFNGAVPSGPWPTGGADANWANVELLLDFDRTDAEPWALWGKGKQAGNPALRSPNNSNFIYTPQGLRSFSAGDSYYTNETNGPSWTPGTGDFTIEAFGVQSESSQTTKMIAGQWSTQNGRRSFSLGIVAAGSVWGFWYSTTGSDSPIISTGRALTTGVVYNLCIERIGTTLRFYENGTMVHSTTLSADIFDAISNNYYFTVGAGAHQAIGTNANTFDGYVKAVRYTKAQARYASDGGYTVPTLPLSRGPEPVLPTVTDGYWRVRVLTHNSTSAGISELEFRTIPYVSELPSSGFPISSRIIDGLNNPHKAFDGLRTGDYWRTPNNFVGDKWLGYYFGATKDVKQVAMSVATSSFVPLTFVIEKSSDGITWTAVSGTLTPASWTVGTFQIFSLFDETIVPEVVKHTIVGASLTSTVIPDIIKHTIIVE